MNLQILAGGGAMGAMLRRHDWARSTLGPPEQWPPALATVVGIMLSANQPMFLCWGSEQILLYNDGYSEILAGHHPALGKPFAEVWPEVIHEVGPIMARAYAGEPTAMDDISLALERNGRPEEAHFSFFYTPIRDETGAVGGVFCACTETTAQVFAARARVAEVARLREMFQQSPSFVCVLRGPEHRFELTNAAYLQLIAHRDVIGKTAREALPELGGQGFFRLLDEVYRSGKPFSAQAMPISLLHSVGAAPEQRFVDFIYQPLRDAGGTVTGIFVEGIDVTEWHAKDHVLRESEEKFRTFTQAVPNHIWTSRPDGQLDWFNERTLVYSGMAADDLVGTGWARLVHPDDLDRASAAWHTALATGTDYQTDFRIRRADGAYRWHVVRGLPIRDADGNVVRWVGTNTDIDDQRADREALMALNATLERRVEERTRERERIWHNAPDLMAVLDTRGVFREVNPAWERLLGWQPQQIVGRSMRTVVHPEELAEADAALARAAVGVLPSFECRMLHSSGDHRSVAWTAAPDGETIFAFGRDITADNLQKHALQLTEEQLRQAQKMEAIGQLTGGIAHDFNNMLATIYGSIQLMQRRLASGRVDDLGALLERSAAGARRAAALTQRLLAFARRQALDIRRVDIRHLIDSLEEMFVRTLGPRIALQTRFAEGLWHAKIDGAQLENALLNLVINARDAMPDGGRLSITAANQTIDSAYAASQAELQAGDYVALGVSDTGAGMAANVIAKAFEPFFTTKPIGQGTGLGLSMVYGFVKQAGGHVRIESEVGRGTTITLFLPRDRLAQSEAAPAASAAPAAPAGEGEIILIVEDEPDVRSVVVAVLHDLGYGYVETADAEAALAVVESAQRIDLLVTDVGLPGMNGRQLAEIACARRPGLKVLFVTGYAEQAAVRGGFLAAHMQMITKPFGIDELARRIRDIIEAPIEEAPP